MKIFIRILILAAALALGAVLTYKITSNRTIEELLTQNRHLKQAISNLSHVEQIGYAKVVSQQQREGKLFTRLKFVQTDPADPTIHLFSEEYEIQGDVVHFDALIIKFSEQLVIDGKERTMYLWRRIYGENMAPEQGMPIETPGKPSPRYAQICEKLSLEETQLFWQEIWDLADSPKKLEHLGVHTIFGNTVYRRLKPGLIYVFKVSATGSLYPEVVPEL
ncbi:hypothetical protein SMSP2_02950 [Limihaloglobus sulfuriphilus]|uniref:Uncharacterized protein n=1 Tax=Limihaloglobus sulfuriphilus TaxID=1851148 RepID=A0A1Q2MIQ5_9BACT|nr:hypothetical protein [Limihaloglobus sulfuriphilus]AQQ72560.1 hypothetical protein SMSP2_02950 [Limihaloglobus sulfuriphilus]